MVKNAVKEGTEQAEIIAKVKKMSYKEQVEWLSETRDNRHSLLQEIVDNMDLTRELTNEEESMLVSRRKKLYGN